MTRKAKATTAVVKVDNPYFSTSHPEGFGNPRTTDAVVVLRESSITTLAALGLLDADQVAAAWRYKRAWESVQSTGIAAVGFSEWLDSGQRPEMSERRLRAASDMRHAADVLGIHGTWLVSRVCGYGYHIRDIYPSRRDRDTATDMLRTYLTVLAREWH
jgi:hypothetical protein